MFQPPLSTSIAKSDETACFHRYELHHGVRISDSALVEAAELSNRYIADRFLPDKAIDIIDESAAKLKMEITSKPLALDEIDRKVCCSMPTRQHGTIQHVPAMACFQCSEQLTASMWHHVQVLQLEMERFSLSKGADSDKAAKARLKGIDKQLKDLKEEQKVGW